MMAASFGPYAAISVRDHDAAFRSSQLTGRLHRLTLPGPVDLIKQTV
jgi:hypothetical protein